MKRCENSTIIFDSDKPSCVSFASVAGKKEGEGPMGKYFDKIIEDAYFGKESWEKAETELFKMTRELAFFKGGFKECDIDYALSGDLINQCTSSSFSLRGTDIGYLGLYGACSTIAEALFLGSVLVASNGASFVSCQSGSHFCSAEKQYRMPLEYGGQRPPTSQWTATLSGCVVLSKKADPPYIDSVTTGRIIDMGIKDANNMGSAMAPAFADTLIRHFEATGRCPDDYDLILSGDLGKIGSEIALDLLKRQNINIKNKYKDCGAMLFDPIKQDTHSGGSGAGCASGILCGYVLPKLKRKNLKKVLLLATGALLSPVTVMQKESIPSVCHAVSFEA